MKQKKTIYFLLILFITQICLNKIYCENKVEKNSPKLTLIIVIDQFGYSYLSKLEKYLTGGIKFLINNGINYKNAFFPHSIPSTAPGHTMLATGAYGYNHGIVNNRWFDTEGNMITSDSDTSKNSAVFKPDGTLYDYARSAKNIMVDGLSDQLILNSYPMAKNLVWSLSLKSRSAIAMAGKLGKAIWFDEKTGNFTSSNYYFKKLPDWLIDFNKREKISKIKSFTWNTYYPKNSYKYNFKFIDDYKYASVESLISKKIEMNQNYKDYDEKYTLTPMANQNLINLAQTCIENNIPKEESERLILWLSLSSLDKVGHRLGPWARESIDMIYQMDAQLKKLIDFIYSKFNQEDVLFVLTADHGVMPISQQLKKLGLDIAKRYTSKNIKNKLNCIIKEKYSINELVKHFTEPQFYLDQNKLKNIDNKTLDNIYKDIKNYLLSLPGIRKVWTYEELSNTIFDAGDTDIYLKRQLYPGRSGQIIYSVAPYTMIDKHELGTSHNTKYANDTQIPLIFYQKNKFQNKNIYYPNVFITQVAPTLANILNIPRPSDATSNILPKILN